MISKTGDLVRRLKGIMMRRVHGMITCCEFETFVQQYLDDDLPDRQRTIFEWHMRLCRECREYLAAYQRSIEIGQTVFSDPENALPDDVPDDLVTAVLDATRR